MEHGKQPCYDLILRFIILCEEKRNKKSELLKPKIPYFNNPLLNDSSKFFSNFLLKNGNPINL